MIKRKRDLLERFISEQTLGPGISGFRFVDLLNDDIFKKKLIDQNPLDHNKELINIVPGGVYSTGILFPSDKSNQSSLTNLHDKEPVPGEDAQISGMRETDDDSIEENDIIRIDQMYPNTMGFTCCLDHQVLNEPHVSVRITARYYTKVNRKDETFNSRYGVLCECDSNILQSLIANNVLNDKIIIVDKPFDKILLINKISSDEIASLRMLLRSITENKSDEFQKKLADFNFSLKARSLSALKQSCYYELKNQCVISGDRQALYNISQDIEEVENAISHIDDLIQLNDSGYGLWQSNLIEIDVSLPEAIPNNLTTKRSFTYRDHGSLKNVFKYDLGNEKYAGLSINFQVSKNSRKDDNKIFLKVQLVNTSTAFEKEEGNSRYYSAFNEEVNTRSFFGTKLSISNKYIVPYNGIDFENPKAKFNEDFTTKFIYREFTDYGIGHGCSVKWKYCDDRTIRVETEYIPVADTPDVDPTPRNKELIVETDEGFEPTSFIQSSEALEMKWLSIFSTATDQDVSIGLKDFIDSYGSWIKSKQKKYGSKPDPIKKLANHELAKCELDKNRMIQNIELFLEGDVNKKNIETFRLMNAVMFMQLWHSVKVRDDKVKIFFDGIDFKGFDFEFYKACDDALYEKNKAAWRPFQLAFIILNLDGIFRADKDVRWEMRNEFVDLVWFPTGGGKTEAYLGLIALTIINRRRQFHEIGGGTAAIMRYTLRLLTLQQFQRATLMIMALELLRRWDNFDLGKEPIFIGLWVGDNSLPNRMLPRNESDKNNLLTEFHKLAQGNRSKIPYEYCPWCKSKLSPANQEISNRLDVFHYNRLHLKCSNIKCSFSFLRPARARIDQGPIPVSLCDEEIYQHPPALLFGTVDKFAQLAHKVSDEKNLRNKDSRRLFGKGNWENGKPTEGYLPPDLIIQDELHLLLGPLGSSVALFESAIEQLCRRKDGTRPKIISSTATTRNTELQIMALFDRHVNLFPKPGVECDDSFFAFYKRRFKNKDGDVQEFISKRRYLGILPTGRTQIWMQIRLAAILMTHRALFELQELKDRNPLDSGSYETFEKAMDYYHTIVSYFNSLKEVGKTESQIHTYIIKEIRRVFNRVIRPKKLMHAFYTYSIRKAELTGRLSGEEVKTELEKVQSKWIPMKRFAFEVDTVVSSGYAPPDFVVATNMISVGIDVSRFNSLIINSMPRNIAEYIQASSRVARESYGLVLTVHHPFRARDISHYEKFIEFHEKMYSYVEPISITPFTKKAVERYLGLYLATMIRHTTPFINRNSANDISQLNDKQIVDLIEHLSNYFQKRKVHLHSMFVEDVIKNLLREQNVTNIRTWINDAINEWNSFEHAIAADGKTLVFNNKKKVNPPNRPQEQLYVDIEEYEGNIHSEKWQVPMSLRVIEPEAVLKIKLK